MYQKNLKLDKSVLVELSSNEKRLCEGGGPGLAMIGFLYGGMSGVVAVAFSGNATANNIWKGYVSGALTGAAVGALIPSP